MWRRIERIRTITETFTYLTGTAFSDRTRTSVISRSLAEQLADAFEANGMGDGEYPFNEDVPIALLGQRERPRSPARYRAISALVATVEAAGLSHEPDSSNQFATRPDWTWDVDAVQRQRAEERRRQARIASCSGVSPHAPVVAYLLSRASASTGRFEPKASDLSWMATKAREDRRREDRRREDRRREDRRREGTIQGERRLIGPTPYQPKPGCAMRLKLKEAVSYLYRQEAYADHQEWVVPVEGELGDEATCHTNLNQFAEALRTTNGMAGVGSSYGFSLQRAGDGWVVVIDQRSSIPD